MKYLSVPSVLIFFPPLPTLLFYIIIAGMNGNKKYGEEITKKCYYDYPETLRFDLYFSGILREERISGVVSAGH